MLVHGKFCGYDFSYTRIYWCMGRNLWEFLYGYFGHVGVFCAWLWKNLVVVYGHVKTFDYGEILVGHWFFVVVGHCFLLWWGIGCENFFGHVDFDRGKNFGHVILVMVIFWTCDFGYGKSLDVILVMGNFLIIWKL